MSSDGSLAAIAAAAAISFIALRRCLIRKPNPKPSTALVPASQSMHPFVEAIPPLRAPGPTGFTIASINILLKKFATRSYGTYVPAPFRDWETHRLPLLLAVLRNLDTDIIAVQEASVLTFAKEIAPFLETCGYGLVEPFDKDAVKKGHDHAKTGILYRTSVFSVVWTQHRSRTVIASFVHKATGNVVYVINCHLEGHPAKAKERFQQMKTSLTVADAHWGALVGSPEKGQANAKKKGKPQKKAKHAGEASSPPVACGGNAASASSAGSEKRAASSEAHHDASVPEEGSARPAKPFVVVLGDFNSSREHCVYTLLHDGYLEPEFSDSWAEGDGRVTDTLYTCPFKLKDVYEGTRAQKGTFLGDRKHTTMIDFVFASESLGVEAVRPPYNEEQYEDALRTGIPNAWCVSDHFPLAASLRFP